jgi:uncharacterized protein with FMN-binding domain
MNETGKTGHGEQDRSPSRSTKVDRALAIVAIAALIAAWIIGSFRKEAQLTPFLQKAAPEAKRLEPLENGTYAAWFESPGVEPVVYLATGQAHGYGGVLKVVTAVSKEGTVKAVVIVEHKETFPFLQRVLSRDVLRALEGKSHRDAFMVGKDVDAIAGATYTTRALAEAARRGSRKIARGILKVPTPDEPPLEIVFGFPEIMLILLFIAAYVGSLVSLKYRKTMRWITMMTAMVTLGFVLGKPLTSIVVNKILLGYWPQWQLNLYWYILVAGLLFFLLAANKNVYCDRICPFGAAQEGVGLIGGAKVKAPEKIRIAARWVQRVLALSVIAAALLFSNPAFYSYEVFGVFFRLIGTTFLYGLLAAVLVAALFIKRPWCNFLCPLRPVMDMVRMMRQWIASSLFKTKKKEKGTG